MRNRSLLPLMEQICMIAVFALAAALCLQSFTLANRISNDQINKDHAVIMAQNAAEVLKSVSGDFDEACAIHGGSHHGSNWYISYDGDWNPLTSRDGEVYSVQAFHRETGDPFLGSATIYVQQDGEILYTLTVGWQEVSDETH